MLRKTSLKAYFGPNVNLISWGFIIEVQTLRRAKRAIIETTEPIYELEINRETEEEKQKRDVRSQEKKVNW